MAAVAGRREGEVRSVYDRFDAGSVRAQCDAAMVETLCRCDAAYPALLSELASPPAVLHVCGGLDRFAEAMSTATVAVVGSRRPSSYGVEMSTALGRELAVCGVPVISGLALGIDAAAHSGALQGDGFTVGVLPGGAERPYPPSVRQLHRRIVASGATVSELPPGTAVRRWMFPARNRIIAGLGAMTVVVEAAVRSGALITAAVAAALGRPVGAVPGRVSSPSAAGPNALLADGAHVVRGARDAVELLPGVDATRYAGSRAQPPEELRGLFAAIADGVDTTDGLQGAGFGLSETLAGLASLELAGHVRRQAGGRFTIVM
jgi:DNA processing protein